MDHRSQASNRTPMKSPFAGALGWTFVALLVLTGPALAADAVLSWAPNTESDLAGYTVHYGTSSGVYSVVIPVGTRTSYTVTGLGPGTYFFAVTAQNTAGASSAFSNEGRKTIADTTAPTISAVAASGITATGATLTWTTNEPASTAAEYGTTTSYGTSTPIDSTLVTAHTRALSGLTPATTYHFRVLSLDATGNVAMSADYTFTTTAAGDTTAPTLSSIVAGAVTSAGAVITWTTNEAASTQVEYGPTTAYGASTALNATLLTAHSATLTGLQASTTYNYRVRSADAAGNVALSGNRTFTTTAAPDTAAPSIFNIATTDVTPTSAVVTWTTNEPATSQVEYGRTTSYGQRSVANATLMTTHRESLAGLSPGTSYHLRVLSADAAGNLSLSNDRVVVVPSAADTTPPQDVQNFSAAGASAHITLGWINPPDADFAGVQIRFRTDRYPAGPNDGDLLGDFSGNPGEPGQAVHDGVVNGVTYYYAAASYDRSGNRQNTMYTSATLGATENPSTEAPQTGGCGMIVPNGGDPPGPWQAADLLILAGVALYLMMRRRLIPRYRSAMPGRWGYNSSRVFGPARSGWWSDGPALSTAPAGGAVRWVAV